MRKFHHRRQLISRNRLFESLEARQLLADVLVDVRLLGAAAGAGKSVSVPENGTFTLGVYLKNIQSAAAISSHAGNGLGSFTFGLRSTSEKYKSGTAWPVSPTPTDTVVNAIGSENKQPGGVFDIGYSDGVVQDIVASNPALGLPADTDTDIDVSGVGGTQYDTGSPAYTIGLGVSSEILLGTVTYKAADLSDASRGFNRTAQINALFTNAAGVFGGLVIKGLINNKTDTTNQVSSVNLITAQNQIGSAVTVTVTGTNPVVGSIAGKVFEDKNGNNVADAGEPGIAGVSMFIDADKDGVLDAGEATSTTTAAGEYSFGGLAAGSHRVREVVPAGYKVTSPAAGYLDITLTTGQNVTGRNFANTKTGTGTTGSISGTVFSDTDKDGVLDAGETKLSNRKMFIDANSNGKLDAGEKTALTNASGVYTFSGLAAGNYRIRRADQPAGYFYTVPASGYYDVALAAGQVVTGKDFGAAQGSGGGGNTASISGTVFSDTDKDGVLDAGETKLSNRKIYIDANKNGKLDAGEKTALTNASGVYTFSGLAAGNYRIRRADQPAGYYYTVPASGFYDIVLAAAQVVTGRNFGAALGAAPAGGGGGGGGSASISGTVFSDSDKDGLLDATDTTLANRKMYIDANQNGKLDAGETTAISNAGGVYTFAGLSAGTYRIRRADLPGGYQITTPAGGFFDITVAGSESIIGKDFGAAM